MRCRDYWKPHRDNCKNFIRHYVLKLKQKKSVLVLGSGPLHEIPIEELSTQFEKERYEYASSKAQIMS
jgi:hypothetical protein